jgi:Domain of unknown function (DUF4397)
MFSSLRSSIILVVFLAMVVGYSREAQPNQSVRTTTEQGSSSAPPASQSAERDKAQVRVVHAMPNGPNVDVFADETVAFSDVSYKRVTPYKDLPDDKLAFRIRPTGQVKAETLAENSEILKGGRHYTVIAMVDDAGKSTIRVLSDDLTPAPENQARVRVFNAAPEADEIDVVAQGGGKKIFDGVNFGSETGYENVEPMTVALEVRREGKKEIVTTILNQKWEAGKSYTIILAGRGKLNAIALDAITIEDQVGTSAAYARPYLGGFKYLS